MLGGRRGGGGDGKQLDKMRDYGSESDGWSQRRQAYADERKHACGMRAGGFGAHSTQFVEGSVQRNWGSGKCCWGWGLECTAVGGCGWRRRTRRGA